MKANLTAIMIAVIMGVFMLTLSYSAYVGFSDVYQGEFTIDNNFSSSYNEISDYGENVSSIGLGFSKWNVINAVYTGIGASLSVFVVGLSAIGDFFNMIPVISSIFTVLKERIPGVTAVIGMFVTILTIWIAMKAYQAIKGTTEEP